MRTVLRDRSLIIVQDELVRGLHIGQHCSIIGIPVYDVVETQGHWVGNVCLEVCREINDFIEDCSELLLQANNVILDSGVSMQISKQDGGLLV